MFENVVTIVAALLGVWLVLRIINRFANPMVRAASNLATGFNFAKATMWMLKEGQLLHVLDCEIREIGEAMLMDGASTYDANMTMLQLWAERIIEDFPSKIAYSGLATNIPGYGLRRTRR